MSFQEKRSLATLIAGFAIFAIYFAIVLSRYQALPPEVVAAAGRLLRFWAAAMLILIPVSVVAHIIILILFMIGFVVAMAVVVLNWSVTAMFLAFAVSGLIAEIVSEAAKIRYYRRGV